MLLDICPGTYRAFGGVVMAGIVRVSRPCNSCPREESCVVGRKHHCPRFVSYTQARLRIRAHQRFTRDLALMFARREIQP